jgi:hypothetical protein
MAEGVDVRDRLFRVFDDRPFMRSCRQLPSCLALPPRPWFSPVCGGGLPPLGHRALFAACSASARVLAGDLSGGRRCLAADGCGRRSTRSPLSIRQRTRPWAALVRSNDYRALAVLPSAWIAERRRSQWGHCVSIRLLLGNLPSRGSITPARVGLRHAPSRG